MATESTGRHINRKKGYHHLDLRKLEPHNGPVAAKFQGYIQSKTTISKKKIDILLE